MTFEIEKGVPIPPPKTGSPGMGLTATLRSMEPGDSILLRDKTSADLAGIRGALNRKGIRLTTRQTSLGLRVWRV